MKNYKKNPRKFNKEMYEFLKIHGKEHTVKEWLDIINKKYNENYIFKELSNYFVKRKIDYKKEDKNSILPNHTAPIGAERIKPNSNGKIQIKIANHKWEYKHRYLYEKYHNVKLTRNDFIIFLDNDNTNFDINNLMCVNNQEYRTLNNFNLHSNNAEVTKLAIDSIRLKLKAKEKKELTNEKKI